MINRNEQNYSDQIWQVTREEDTNYFNRLVEESPNRLPQQRVEKNDAEAEEILESSEKDLEKLNKALGLAKSSKTIAKIHEQRLKYFKDHPHHALETMRSIIQSNADERDGNSKYRVDLKKQLFELTRKNTLRERFSRIQQCSPYPQFVKGLELYQDTETGRSVAATVAFKVGEKIVESKPFAWALPNGFDTAYCLSCGVRGGALIPCAKCSNAFFCDYKCQFEHSIHQYVCKTTFHSDQTIDRDTKCAIQMVLQCIANTNGDIDELEKKAMELPNKSRKIPAECKSVNEQYECILRLKAIFSNDFEDKLEKAYNILIALPEIKELIETNDETSDISWMDKRKYFLQHLLGHYIGVLNANGLEINFGDQSAIAIYDVVSFFNHSCTPNVGITFKGTCNFHCCCW